MEWEKHQPLLHALGYEFSRDADIDGGCIVVKACKRDGTMTETYVPCRLITKLSQAMERQR